MQLGLSLFFKTQVLEKRNCSTRLESGARAWFLPQRFGAGLRPMHLFFLKNPMFVQLCLSCKYKLHSNNIGRKACVPLNTVSLLLAAVMWGQTTKCRREAPGEAGEQRGGEMQSGLITEVKKRRSGEVGVGMMREEGRLAAVPRPGRAEGNVLCHREMEYPQ